jgi:dynein heavy chain
MEGFIVPGCKVTKFTAKADWQKGLNFILGYSFIWSFGGNFKLSAGRFLDNMMRDFFSSLHIPDNDSVFDYKFDGVSKFIAWKDILDPFVYESAQVPFFKLVVPTVDTMRYSSMLDHLTRMNKPVYFTGSTGTGKSMIVQNYINENRQNQNLSPIILNFSA